MQPVQTALAVAYMGHSRGLDQQNWTDLCTYHARYDPITTCHIKAAEKPCFWYICTTKPADSGRVTFHRVLQPGSLTWLLPTLHCPLKVLLSDLALQWSHEPKHFRYPPPTLRLSWSQEEFLKPYFELINITLKWSVHFRGFFLKL